jgi:hypothetical protein
MTFANTRQNQPRRRLEAQLEAQCTPILEYDGWRTFKTDPPHLRGLGVLEKGIPDRLYIRYRWRAQFNPSAKVGPEAVAEVLWIEWKSPTGRLSPVQETWHARELVRGGLIWLAGVDFDATFEGFKLHYRSSGLARRPG